MFIIENDMGTSSHYQHLIAHMSQVLINLKTKRDAAQAEADVAFHLYPYEQGDTTQCSLEIDSLTEKHKQSCIATNKYNEAERKFEQVLDILKAAEKGIEATEDELALLVSARELFFSTYMKKQKSTLLLLQVRSSM